MSKMLEAGVIGKLCRPYQIVGRDAILKILAAQKRELTPRAQLIMPTGSGKTMVAFSIIEKLFKDKTGTAAFVVHQSSLFAQSAESLQSRHPQILFKMKNGVLVAKLGNCTIYFQTWQGLRNRISKGDKFDLLIVDENHYGSSASGSVNSEMHKSFKTILRSKNIKMHLYVSATPFELNPEVYPGMLDSNGNFLPQYTYTLTDEEAMRLGIIMNFQIVTVNSENYLRGKDEFGAFKLVGATEVLQKGCKARKVDVRDSRTKNSLDKAICETMIYTVFESEFSNGTIPSMLIYCRDVNGRSHLSVPTVKKEIKRVAKRFGLTTDSGLVQVAHGSMAKDDAQAAFNAFTSGETKILLVADLAQEGFDFPALEVVVDLAPSFDNPRRLKQKFGRVQRVYEGKRVPRYYIPNSLRHRLANNRIFVPEMVDGIRQRIRQSNPALSETAVEACTQNALDKMALENAVKNVGNSLQGDSSVSFDPSQITELVMPNTGADLSKKLKPKRSVYRSVANCYLIDAGVKGDATVSFNSYAALQMQGPEVRKIIKNITEENLLYLLRTGKVDERIYA